MTKHKKPMKLWKVTFARLYRKVWRNRKAVMVFADDIDGAKVEARLMRPDCEKLDVIEVNRIGKV